MSNPGFVTQGDLRIGQSVPVAVCLLLSNESQRGIEPFVFDDRSLTDASIVFGVDSVRELTVIVEQRDVAIVVLTLRLGVSTAYAEVSRNAR